MRKPLHDHFNERESQLKSYTENIYKLEVQVQMKVCRQDADLLVLRITTTYFQYSCVAVSS